MNEDAWKAAKGPYPPMMSKKGQTTRRRAQQWSWKNAGKCTNKSEGRRTAWPLNGHRRVLLLGVRMRCVGPPGGGCDEMVALCRTQDRHTPKEEDIELTVCLRISYSLELCLLFALLCFALLCHPVPLPPNSPKQSTHTQPTHG